MSTLTPGGLMKNLAKTGAPYDGTINGALVLAPPLIRAKRTKCMIFNTALPNYINLASPISGLTTFSVVTWVSTSAIGSKIVWGRGGAAGTYLYMFQVISNDTYRFVVGSGGYRDTPQLHPINTTYMVACVFNNNYNSVYVNGKLESPSVATGANPVDATFKIGAFWDNSLPYGGYIDNFLSYNIALTPDQIWSIYKSANPRM
jgi:hypothetical protein